MDSNRVKDGYCFQCGGLGFDDKVCPSCGLPPKSKTFNFENKTDTDAFLRKIEDTGIPGKYKGVLWQSELLQHSFPELDSDLNFSRFVNQLDKVHKVFSSGVISSKSAIIIAPAGYSKMTFAYSCMQKALDNGLTVAPLLDTVELKRLLVLAAERPYYKLYNKVDYDSYVQSDVCFVTVTKLEQRAWAYEAIQELLDRRSRLGLGTFVMSRYDLSEISKNDRSEQFSAITTASSKDDYKYPAIIRYRKLNK